MVDWAVNHFLSYLLLFVTGKGQECDGAHRAADGEVDDGRGVFGKHKAM